MTYIIDSSGVYRLVEEGEVIMAGDEFYHLSNKWVDHVPDNFGKIYNQMAYFQTRRRLTGEQPKTRDIADLLIERIKERKELGAKQYGRPLRFDSTVKGFDEAIDEAIDLAQYLWLGKEQLRLAQAEMAALKAEIAKLKAND